MIVQYRFTNLDQLASFFLEKGAQLRASIKQREAGNTPPTLSYMNRQRLTAAAIWEQAAFIIRNTKLGKQNQQLEPKREDQHNG